MVESCHILVVECINIRLPLSHYEDIALSLSLNIWLMLLQYEDGIHSLSFSTKLILPLCE